MEEKSNSNNFNWGNYICKMLICSVIWLFIACLILSNIETFFSQEQVKIQFNPDNVFSFKIGDAIAILIAVISHYIIMVKGEVYPYSFKTKCKNPFFYLFLNILFGGFVCFVLSELFANGEIDAAYVAKAFIIISGVNYFLFYARYGHEYREAAYLEEWHNTVNHPLNYFDNKK